MSSIAIVGLQWGDEGKGKVIDLLSERAQHIVRAQGGNNAGHTVMTNAHEYRFHLIPSGILYPHTTCYIGGGTVIDPTSLLIEFETLRKHCIPFEGRLFISSYAHLIFPWHRLIDRLAEEAKGKQAVGTTGRGIGPCYMDRVGRTGMRMADLFDRHFEAQLRHILTLKNGELRRLYDHPPLEFGPIYDQVRIEATHLKEFVAPVEEKIAIALKNRERILFEGAQGALLDIGFGTYPFVTSSCTMAGGLASGAGVGPTAIAQTIGVVKAYSTRVGNGPMPTELNSVELTRFQTHDAAREIGTTTGRKRRLGWLDCPLLRHTIRLNSVDRLALMKLDVLDTLDEILICSGYKGHSHLPVTESEWRDAQPIYESHPGWKQPTRGVEVYADLPSQAKAYIRRIEELCDVPVALVSVGPEREKTLWLDRFFE